MAPHLRCVSAIADRGTTSRLHLMVTLLLDFIISPELLNTHLYFLQKFAFLVQRLKKYYKVKMDFSRLIILVGKC